MPTETGKPQRWRENGCFHHFYFLSLPQATFFRILCQDCLLALYRQELCGLFCSWLPPLIQIAEGKRAQTKTAFTSAGKCLAEFAWIVLCLETYALMYKSQNQCNKKNWNQVLVVAWQLWWDTVAQSQVSFLCDVLPFLPCVLYFICPHWLTGYGPDLK